jgi:hypothetical protein
MNWQQRFALITSGGWGMQQHLQAQVVEFGALGCKSLPGVHISVNQAIPHIRK